MRKVAFILILAVLLTGCAPFAQQEQKHTETFLTLFDTVTTVIGYDSSREAFSQKAQGIYEELQVYHQLFDIYNNYEGINNLKSINDAAGGKAVQVDERLITFLLDCKKYYELTDGYVNTAMGSVLKLWHDAREAAKDAPAALPDQAALEQAAHHTDFNAVIIDTAASTVRITDPELRLDVGAVGKGWAAQQVAAKAPAGLLISVGGNVCATGPKDAAGTPWVVGIQNPADPGTNLHTLNLRQGCVVTSGDYQRSYTVDGKAYHHIIDPQTLFPSELWRSVTIVCDDSGLADVLSTALFLMPREKGQALLDKCGAKALWVDLGGNIYYSPGFEALLR